MPRLTIWMNMPSFYQADLFRALAALPEVDLEVVFARRLSPDREQLGWQNDLEGYSHSFLEGPVPVFDAMRAAWTGRRRVHVVNGIWAEPSFAAALAVLVASNARYAIYSEAANPLESRSYAKVLLRSVFGKLISWRAVGFLPISHLGAALYRGLGAPEKTIYPFGYFRSPPATTPIPVTGNRVEVIFAGQLIARKGVDLLLEAMLPLLTDHSNLTLTLIGNGPLLTDLQATVKAAGMEDRVLFPGVLPAPQIPARIASAAVLVLPSRWDGWGLVVNEALSVGVPVIVSDQCGASDLVDHGRNGYIFTSEDAMGLRSCVETFLKSESAWPQFRAEALRTGRSVSTDKMAPYLVQCLNHMIGETTLRPTPPWVDVEVRQP